MENHHFQWVNPLQMAIFNSYVKLPESILPPFISINFITTEARAPMRRDAAEIINSDPATVAKCLGVLRTLGC
jgi:hypothetical protein